MKKKYSENAKKLMNTMGQTFRDKRLEKNKSQRVLAYEYDIQKSLISRLENSNNEGGIVSIWILCEALGLKPSEYFKIIEEKLPDDFSLTEK